MELRWQRLDGRNGHTVGRMLLAEMVHPLPQIRTTPQGKPYFLDCDLHFSISHSQNHVFCCVSTKNIGIDAEEIGRPIDLRLADRYLSVGEKEHLYRSANKEDTLLRLWVQKESYAKLTGRGLGNYLKETDFDPADIQIIDGCYVAIMEEGE